MPRAAITNAADLPKIGTNEAIDLEFKAWVSPEASYRFELAKDIAALANALGGSLIIGACEEPPGRLDSYRTLSDADAIVTAYEQAVRDRCRPAPLFACKQIETDDGKIVIAVNVQPTMAQPSAVHFDREAWCFPIRVATQTRYLSPEVLPMYMLPKVRRTWLLLQSIPKESRVDLQRYLPNQSHRSSHVVILKNVDETRNVVSVASVENTSAYNVPLDRIESVYNDGSKWIIICPY